ncbi:MAG: hypothetical protein H6662_03725 [Ardenticatenaceae bacterium]|nr:hypothetical protein [Ardenticatenaceae bacterium]MCB9002910.1 hypothetical protein [Ardenticatenaceae bacterium]
MRELVNFLFSDVPDIVTNDLLDTVMAEFFAGGTTFDFGNYDDRVLLGQELIRLLYENE